MREAPQINLQPDIIIAAGEAYGSGAHPTTALTIQALQGIVKARSDLRHILDVGCGSGVLSIAIALMLPHTQVIASDTNIKAPEFTMHNAELNQVQHRITALRADGLQHDVIRNHAPYDLIMCNILTDVIITLLSDIKSHLAYSGFAILCGIRKQHEHTINEALCYCNLIHITTIEQTGWLAMIVQNGDLT